MNNARFILMLLFRTVCLAMFAVTPIAMSEPAEPFILNDAALDSITAGSVSSTTGVSAEGLGLSFAETQSDTDTRALSALNLPKLEDDNSAIGRMGQPGSESGGDSAFGFGVGPFLELDLWKVRLAKAPGFERFGWASVRSGSEAPSMRPERLSDRAQSDLDAENFGGSLAPSRNGLIPYRFEPSGAFAGNRITRGEGRAFARGDRSAVTEGVSRSELGSTGLVVAGRAVGSGKQANAHTRVSTRGIDNGRVRILIGGVETMACCGPDAKTSIQAEIYGENDLSFSRVALEQANSSQMSGAIGRAILVTLSPP